MNSEEIQLAQMWSAIRGSFPFLANTDDTDSDIVDECHLDSMQMIELV
jgi:hypothetical protein